MADHILFVLLLQDGDERGDRVRGGELAENVGDFVTGCANEGKYLISQKSSRTHSPEQRTLVPKPTRQRENGLFATIIPECEHGTVALEEGEGGIVEVSLELVDREG